MDATPLLKMANQIGQFFAAFPDREEAVTGIAQHLQRFWEPRMQRALFAQLDATSGAGSLDPLVQEAVDRLRGSGRPAA